MGNLISPSYNVASHRVYHFSRNQVYPSGCCLCQQFWQERMSLVLGVCVSVSISGVCKAVLSVTVTGLLGVCVCFCLSGSMQLCQRLWHVCRFRAAVLLTPWSRSPFSGRQVMPSPQSHRWKSSKPWVPFLRCRVHTWPTVSTGLQMRDQKCLAQHRPSEQSADLKQVSPSMPGKMKKRCQKIKMCSSEPANWNLLHYYFSPVKKMWFFGRNLPFTATGWWPWAVGGFLVWCSIVLLCLCKLVMMDASVPSMSLAWQTPGRVKRKKLISALCVPQWTLNHPYPPQMDLADMRGSKTTTKVLPVISAIYHLVDHKLMPLIMPLLKTECLSLPLLQRFPAQHMESRAQRFRLFRQGRQAPRASLQNSSAPHSSSYVQTPDCYYLRKQNIM